MVRLIISAGFLVMASVIVPRQISAQSLIVPEHVISEPVLWIGSGNQTSCGYRIHNMVLRKPFVFDYDLQLILMLGSDEAGAAYYTAFVAGRIYKSLADAPDPKTTATSVKPIDLYIAIPNVPELVKLEEINPGTAGAPIGFFTGFPLKASGTGADIEASSKLMEAVVSRKPLLVSFVMDSSSSGTHIVRVVNNLTHEQEDAITDCLDRQIFRAQKLGK